MGGCDALHPISSSDMLARHFISYLFARGLPGIINFAALAIYTRLLTTDEFGRYSLVLSAVGLVHVLVYQWLLLVLGRFYPRVDDNPHELQQHVLALFLLLSALVLVTALASIAVWSTAQAASLIMLAALLAITQAWHELNLRLATASLTPGTYGRQLGAKSLLAIAIGALLAWLGWGAKAPVIALIIGSLLGWWWFSRKQWFGIRPRWPTADALNSYRTYGVPLAITFSLVWITASADRLIIGWLLDESAVGHYAVGYDLAQQSLGLLLIIVNTAALPLVIRLLEQEGESAASRQMKHNGELIFTSAMAGAAGLIAIGPLVIELFVGYEFRAGALSVFPWIAVTAAVIGIKSFHFDIAFHLSRQSLWLVLTSGLAAGCSLLLNLLLIPRYGIVGAAWASLAGFSLAMVASAALGARVFPMPNPASMMAKGLGVAAATWVAARSVTGVGLPTAFALALSLASGASITVLASIALDVAGARQGIAARFRR